MSTTTYVPLDESNKYKTKSIDVQDDKLIGNRRIRIILLSTLLLAFGVFAVAFEFWTLDSCKDLRDLMDSTVGLDGMIVWQTVMNIVMILIMLLSLVTIVVVVLRVFKQELGAHPILGLLLVISGGVYIAAHVLFQASTNKFYKANDITNDITYMAMLLTGEMLMYAGTTILLGIDVMLPHRLLFQSEANRLFANLGLLCAVALLCSPGYLLYGDWPDVSSIPTGATMIGIGYIVVFLTCVLYIFLYVFTCCTCNFKDTCLARLILGISLILGGTLTAIGYYLYAGGMDEASLSIDSGKRVVYYIGYTILMGGLSVIWTLDIAWDDVANLA